MKNAISKFNSIDIKYRLLILAAFLRVVFFVVDLFCGATHVDEAMASITAFELAKSGNDLLGTHLPLYFDEYLYGGQSPMAIYLAAGFVKIFGTTKLAVRLPVLIFNLLSLWAYFEFVSEAFERRRFRIILYSIAAISPWGIFNAAFLLDCNYIAFFIMFGICFLAKAIKKSSTALYALSMLFFGLSFYCYMASVLIVPFLLIVIYLQLIVSKKISFKNTAVSILVVLVTAIPFIALGLVTLGILPRMKFLGFGLTNMQYYSRQDSLSFSDGGGFAATALYIMKNLLSHCLYIFGVDFTIFSEGLNKYHYSNLIGGPFVAFEIIMLIICLIKKKHYDFLQKTFLSGMFFSSLIYCLLVHGASDYILYRYAPMEYFLMFFEGVGIAELSLIFEKIIRKKGFGKGLLVAYLSASLLLFSYSYAFIYLPQIHSLSAFLYGDMYLDTVNKAHELGYDEYTICCNREKYICNLSVFSRYYFYNEKEFTDFGEEALNLRNNVAPELIATDGSIRVSTSSELTAPCCIYLKLDADMFDTDGYNIVDCYEYKIAYK